jgi:photosystem II stability/assembly factor-like uncharacterized protein
VLAGDGGFFRSDDGGTSWKRLAWKLPPPRFNDYLEISDVDFDPSDPAVLYGASTQGVLRSTDGGESWEDYWTSYGADALAFSTLQATLVMLRGHALFANARRCGLFRTDDGGRSWSESLTCLVDPRNSLGPLRAVYELVGDPVDPLTLYALGYEYNAESCSGCSIPPTFYLYKSGDGGASWTKLAPGLNRLAIDLVNPATLYAASDAGIVKSADGGQTWQPLADLQVTHLVVDRHSPATLLAATADRGVLRSTDGGKTWTPINAGLAVRGRLSLGTLIDHPDTPHLFYAISLNFQDLRLSQGIFTIDLSQP